MGSFLKAAGREVTDIRKFLRDATTNNSIKYKPVKGVKHYMYIPFKQVPMIDDEGNETITKNIIAMEGDLHEWTGVDGKYKACICLKDKVRIADDGTTVLNDGSCPFCESVSKAWDIYRYRMDNEKATCGKTGEELNKHLESVKKQFADERKSKDAKKYIYLLVVLYRTDPMKGNTPVIGANNIPEFDLKVMKISAGRMEKIQQLIENTGMEFNGAELVFDYPNEDDPRLVVSQSTVAPIFESRQFSRTYKGLQEAIDAEVSKFEWDGLEKGFPEWEGMTSAEANSTVKELFGAWDEYQIELKTNPNAKYLEYAGSSNTTTTPALGTSEIPTATPTVGVGAVNIPSGIPDANAIFGGAAVPNVGNSTGEINI